MDFQILILLITAGYFLGILLLQEVGRRIGLRHLATDPEGAKAGAGVVQGAVFALLGLLVAFTFYGAAARFDLRRQMVITEANAIGTAYLRLDLLPVKERQELQGRFRRYLDTRLQVYHALPDLNAAEKKLAESNKIQGEIWAEAVAACKSKEAPPSAVIVILPALNEMIDITTTRTATARLMHPPPVIFVLLFLLGLASALMAGFEMADGKKRNWTVILGFASVMAITVFVILDMEYPRVGFIRVDAIDQVLVDLRQSMD